MICRIKYFCLFLQKTSILSSHWILIPIFSISLWLPINLFSQTEYDHRILPYSTQIDYSGFLKVDFIDPAINNSFKETFLYTSTYLPNGFSFNTISQSYFNENNKFCLKPDQLYVNFRKELSLWSFIENGIISVDFGRLAWYPRFNDLILFFNNTDVYTDPDVFWGVSCAFSLSSKILFNTFTFNLEAASGNISENKNFLKNSELKNVNLNLFTSFTPFLSYTMQVGKSFSFKHLINFAYSELTPKWEELLLNFKLGKLQGYDEAPYGIEIGFSRTFSFIQLGAFYQKRLKQERIGADRGSIVGISWQLLKPKPLADFLRRFSIMFNVPGGSVYLNIPVINLTLDY